MRTTRTTLAIFAFAAMFGCTVQSPTTIPTSVQVKLQLPATEATFRRALTYGRRRSAI